MMRKFLPSFFILVVMVGILVPTFSAHAALVTCGRSLNDPLTSWDDTKPCGTCDLLQLVNTLINFIVLKLGPVIATIFILYASFLIIWNGGISQNINKGTEVLKNTLIGLLVLFLSWTLTNTVMRTLAGNNNIATNWYTVECRNTGNGITEGVPVLENGGTNGNGAVCDKQKLAQQYNEPNTATDDPVLVRLMTCIRSEMRSADLGEVSTFDKQYDFCNYTRGNRIPGCTSQCSHTVNSCHYGGGNGKTGALAVDYGNEKIGDQIIQAATACGAKNARCENSEGQTVNCTSSGASHVHVNASACDNN